MAKKFYEITLKKIGDDDNLVWEKVFREEVEQVLARNCYLERTDNNNYSGREPGMRVGENDVSLRVHKDDNGVYLKAVYHDGSFTGNFSSYGICFIELGEEKDIYTEHYESTFGDVFYEFYNHYKAAFRCVEE
ncbi:MAG: hypothetical protein IKD47_05495 [Clostridia bacterium]|nr:hypothetical protein [Clostridia bacterium]